MNLAGLAIDAIIQLLHFSEFVLLIQAVFKKSPSEDGLFTNESGSFLVVWAWHFHF